MFELFIVGGGVDDSGNRQNKMVAVLLKSSIRHLSKLHRHCYHVIIAIKSCRQKLVLSISPKESVCGGKVFPRGR